MFDFFGSEVPDALGVVGLFFASVVTFLWGCMSITLGIKKHRAEERAVRIPVNFSFWMGAFLVSADSVLYFALGWQILRSDNGIPLWGLVITTWEGVVAIIAFIVWARERGEQDV